MKQPTSSHPDTILLMHSHHSHSGEYVSHAVGSLESMVEKAIALNFHIFCLTEHMPRYSAEFLYPEEVEKEYTPNDLESIFESYTTHAFGLKEKVNSDPSCRTKLLVGFEAEGGLGEHHLEKAHQLKGKFDIVVGSVHHVDGIPIDFDKKSWNSAKDLCGGYHGLFLRYYQLKNAMVRKLKPHVVAHFDLIKLFLDSDDLDQDGNKIGSYDLSQVWPDVWDLIKDTVDYVDCYGGFFELNSAALRKGWTSPYPQRDILKLLIAKEAKMCLSDDSHSVAQVGLNYGKVLQYCREMGISRLWFWNPGKEPFADSISLKDAEMDDFWSGV